jgi:hypothetical protein
VNIPWPSKVSNKIPAKIIKSSIGEKSVFLPSANISNIGSFSSLKKTAGMGKGIHSMT